MNRLILLPSDLKSQELAEVTDRRAQHIRSILKCKIGDQIRFGLLNGPIGEAVIEECTKSKVVLKLKFSTKTTIPQLPCSLVLALPRPKVARRLLQSVSTLGIEELHLINSYRVDKSYWQSHYLDSDQLQKELILGAEQSGSTLMPKVFQHNLFRPFVEDILPSLLQNRIGLVAHPYAEDICPVGLNKPSLICIGPEGGFTEFEIELLAAQGILPVSIGQRILKVETAVPALVGRLFT